MSNDTQHGITMDTTDGDRLWTPWRMRYVGGGAKEAGCIFCNRVDHDDDVSSLVVYRGEHAFAILNLFPYNTGHVMLVPNAHVASPEDAPAEALTEIALLTPALLRALRRILGCQGFNIGLNIGAVAGAGVGDHMHQHVVPRWQGDANFMPILAGTTIMPELIPVTYAKVRAEMARELASSLPVDVQLAVISESGTHALLTDRGAIPSATVTGGPVWRIAVEHLRNLGLDAEIVAWAGSTMASPDEQPALLLSALVPMAPVVGHRWVAIGDVVDRIVPGGPSLAELAR